MPYEIPNNNYNPYGYEPIQRPMIPANGMMMQAPIPDTPLAIGDVVNAIREVQRNPSGFSMDEINRARELSMQYLGKDIEFANDLGRTVANTLFDAVDTLAFGLIPDSVGEKFGAKKLSSADEIGSMIGSTAALFTPGVGPMAVGTKIAKKFLPSVAKIGTGAIANVGKVAGEGAGAAAVEGAAKGVGKVANWLGSDMAAARIGSAIGGGFNFEDGINPTGAVLGAMFPMGAGKVNKVTSKADEAASVANKMDMATAGKVVWQQRDTPLGKMMYERYVNGKVVLPSEYQHIAKQFGVSIDDVKNTEELIRNIVKSPKWQIPEKSDMLANLDDINSNAMKAHEKAYNLYTEEVMRPINDIAKVKALPSRTPGIEGVSPVNVLPNSGRVIPVGEAPVNPIVQMGKAQLSITPEMEKLVSQYDMFLGKNIKEMTAKEIIDSYNYLLQFLR